jgi:hypothetical protein
VKNFYTNFLVKKYCFFITNSLGELDFVLPLIFSIKKIKPDAQFTIVIISNKINSQFLSDKFYKGLISSLGIKIKLKSTIFHSLSNNESMKMIKLKEFILVLLNLHNIVHAYLTHEVIFVENSGRAIGAKVIRFINFFKQKNLILYPHTSSKFTNKSKLFTYEKQEVFRNKPFLVFCNTDIKYYRERYFKGEPIFINFPINYQWKNFIYQLLIKYKKNNEIYLSIFLNNFIDKKTYIYLLLISLKNISKFKKNYLVILKRHPRLYRYNEENIILQKIIKKFHNLKIKISTDNILEVSIFSSANICLMSNSVYLCNEMNSNTVYLFLNSFEVKKRFKTLPIPLYDTKIRSFVETKKINQFFNDFKNKL